MNLKCHNPFHCHPLEYSSIPITWITISRVKMIDNVLLNFPLDISCSILTQWIEIKVFVRVDSAHCTISGWRSLCQSPLLALWHELHRMESIPKSAAEVSMSFWVFFSRRSRLYVCHHFRNANENMRILPCKFWPACEIRQDGKADEPSHRLRTM